jgi:hypothetical protein
MTPAYCVVVGVVCLIVGWYLGSLPPGGFL